MGRAWKTDDAHCMESSVKLILALGGAVAFTESGSYYPPADKEGGWRP